MSELDAATTTRRTALKVGSGGALALVLGLGAGWLDRREDAAPTTAPGATDAAASSTTTAAPAPGVIPGIGAVDAGIIALGARIVATTGWNDLAALVEALPDPSGDPIAQASEVARDEFRAARTIDVDGWVLAESEARAAAIVSLLCDEGAC